MPPHQCCLLSAKKYWLLFIVKLCICVLFTLLQVFNLEHGAERWRNFVLILVHNGMYIFKFISTVVNPLFL